MNQGEKLIDGKYKPGAFIGERIAVLFDKLPYRQKTPHAPSAFEWRGEGFTVLEVINEWSDYRRRGDMAHNMRPENMRKALRKGSWGVGRFYFRVRVGNGRIFDLYYDRAPRDAGDRMGSWFLWRELVIPPEEK